MFVFFSPFFLFSFDHFRWNGRFFLLFFSILLNYRFHRIFSCELLQEDLPPPPYSLFAMERLKLEGKARWKSCCFFLVELCVHFVLRCNLYVASLQSMIDLGVAHFFAIIFCVFRSIFVGVTIVLLLHLHSFDIGCTPSGNRIRHSSTFPGSFSTDGEGKANIFFSYGILLI